DRGQLPGPGSDREQARGRVPGPGARAGHRCGRAGRPGHHPARARLRTDGPGSALPEPSFTLPEPAVLGGWLGPGYGVPSTAGQAAARLVAAAEGVFLDPVFGAKAMAALISECRA